MSTAIPIPSVSKRRDLSCSSTTPSLQSVLDQRKCSHHSLRCTSLSSTSINHSHSRDTTSSSVPSLMSLSSLESSESHPLEIVTLMDDIDQNYFDFSDHDKQLELQILKPIRSTPTLSDLNSQELPHQYYFVSNLTRSIRNFTNSTIHRNNDLLFEIQPRLTDDKLPQSIVIQKLQKLQHQQNLKLNDSMEQELETYKITAKNATVISSNPSTTSLDDLSSVSIMRNKEPRINSQFLRLYAYEASSRKKGLLPEITQDEENELLMDQRQLSVNSSNITSLSDKEFAIIVRQRLWNCVVLPPREDSTFFHTPEYVYYDENNQQIDEKNSLMRKLNDIKPSVKLEDEENYNLSDSKRNTALKPRGTLYNNVQFIVKGWCNSRWIPVNH